MINLEKYYKEHVSKEDYYYKFYNELITKAEEDELLDLLVDKPIAVDVEKQEESNLTFGEMRWNMKHLMMKMS